MNQITKLSTLAASAVVFGGLSLSAATITVTTTEISADTTWTAGNEYVLLNPVSVNNMATITIEPGVIIRGTPDVDGVGPDLPGALFITRGATIEAEGTADDPIVFTDLGDDLFMQGGVSTDRKSVV